MTAGAPAGPTLSRADVRDVVRIASGRVAPGRPTLFSVFRDEMYFAPAFLAHYRALGVRQFLILDDGSIDGTAEYLAAQPDVVLLASDLGYGQAITFVDGGKRQAERAGVYFKMAVPPAFVPGEYALYADADEFLFLPPGVSGVDEVIDRLRAMGAAGCVAAIVEFFPERFSDLARELHPETLANLLDHYGWFEAEPMVEIDPQGAPRAVGASKTRSLLRRYDIRVPQRRLRRRIAALVAPEYRKSPQFKTPIFLCGSDDYLVGTHAMRRPAPRTPLLTIGHFVFTSQMAAKVRRALDWRAHLRGADKYEHYATLLSRAAAADPLAGPAAQRYVSPAQFVAAGLMRW